MSFVGTLLLGTAVTLILYGLFKFFFKKKHFFEDQNIAYKRPAAFLMQSIKFTFMQIRLSEWSDFLYGLFPNEKIFGTYNFNVPFYIVRDPETLKQLTIKDFDHFEDHRLFLNDPDLDTMFGNSLLILRGNKWRDMRATLSPAFTGSKMRQMFGLVCECAESISEHYKEKAKRGERIEPEMKELFQFYTNDVIASAAFGLKINSLENPENQFFQMGKGVLAFNTIKGIFKIMGMFIVPWFMRMFSIELIEPHVKNFFKSMVLDTINVREERKIFRPDMINIMMQVKRGNSKDLKDHQHEEQSEKSHDGFATVEESSIGRAIVKRQWTDDEIVAQCFLFFFAGFDTSSTALAFTSYELAVNADIQERVYQEILDTQSQLNGKPISYDAIQKMTYLDMVVSESLRLWPPGMVTDRLCSRDYLYDDGHRKFKIPKDSILFIPIYSYHHDERYFPNPKKFDPERFSDENKGDIVPGTYIPFGTGPRNCIGSRFALMEVKAVLYYLLLNFKFVPTENTQIPLQMAKTPAGLKSEKGIKFQFLPRNQI